MSLRQPSTYTKDPSRDMRSMAHVKRFVIEKISVPFSSSPRIGRSTVWYVKEIVVYLD
jgi:hypothetical protein